MRKNNENSKPQNESQNHPQNNSQNICEQQYNRENSVAETFSAENTSGESSPKLRDRQSAAKKIATVSVLVALGLIFSFIESQIPAFVPIPGIKVGLANIATLFAIYKLGAREGALVSLLRVSISSLLFGSITGFLYGLAGAVISFVVMLCIRRLGFGVIAVSTLGGVSHNIAQILVAILILRTGAVIYYLPFLLLSGALAGIIIGLIGALLIKKVKI